MTSDQFSFSAEVWEHEGPGSWHFVSLPAAVADQIEETFGQRAAGFGSVRIEVAVGVTTWRTSIFPDAKRQTYVLPLKKAVRVAEGLASGSTAEFQLRVVA